MKRPYRNLVEECSSRTITELLDLVAKTDLTVATVMISSWEMWKHPLEWDFLTFLNPFPIGEILRSCGPIATDRRDKISQRNMMSIEAVLTFTDELIYTKTGENLSDLQRVILRESWQETKKTMTRWFKIMVTHLTTSSKRLPLSSGDSSPNG